MVALLIVDNLLQFDNILFMFFWRFADLQYCRSVTHSTLRLDCDVKSIIRSLSARSVISLSAGLVCVIIND